MTNDSLLKILRRNGRSSDADLAERVSVSEEAVREQISAWESD
ncbi:MAG TPA: AsnC family transcriptional regulator, partial [Verrucomicrobiales bacterium]|nr:AsnC family transcriptional regulator [Verrucomicrobiales bacterium]